MIEFDLPAPLAEPPAAPPPPDADIPPEAFGARQAAALMPETVDDPLYRREAATANATRAEELNNDFIGRQREILHTGPDAFYRRQGRDAILAASDAIGRLNAAQDEVLGQAATPSQRAMLSKILDNHMIVAHYGIGSHIGRQSLEWQKGVAQARLDQLHAQARVDYGDRNQIDTYAEAGEGAAQDHARLSGLPATSDEAQARMAGARSAIYRTAIEGALAANDSRAASTLHDQAKDCLTPADAAVLEPQLRAAAEVETARDYVGKIVSTPSEPAAYFDAPRLMAEADAAHQAATEQNNTDWADHPTQRATNQHLIDVQFGLQRRGIEQTKAELDSKVKDWLKQPMPDGQPQINRPPLALWTKLGPEQQQGIDAILARNAWGASIVPVGLGQDQSASDPAVMSNAYPEEPNDGDQVAQAPEPLPPPGSPEREAARRELDQIPVGRGVGPPTEPPSNSLELEREFQKWDGRLVRLPDGSLVSDPYSENGFMMSPFADLSDVAEAGMRSLSEADAFLARPDVAPAAFLRLMRDALKENIAQGGTFDYQRRKYKFGKDGFTQLRQFRDVSNFNVGLFCQQAGLSLKLTLWLAGRYAGKYSSNARPGEPDGLDPRTREYIERGYQIGESGAYNPPDRH